MAKRPLALVDRSGRDAVFAVKEMLHRDFNDPKYRPTPVLEKSDAAGGVGRKSGRGFYTCEGAN